MLIRKLKSRFMPTIQFEIDDATLVLGLQLGWFEKFMGKWQFTEKGQEEFVAYLKEMNYANVRA